MFDRPDDLLERVIQHLRRSVAIDPALDARVMGAIRSFPVPDGGRRTARLWPWLAAAAVLGALIVARPWSPRTPRDRSDARQFVLVAPRATSVALVGDFNDWDPARTPMHAARGGVWATIVPLAPGRYRYAFLVNGAEWHADPGAPTVADDEFGTPSSVVTVGGS